MGAAQPAETVPRKRVRPARTGGKPSIALALGAGGARGLAHIQVIEALDEMGIRPAAIAGSSIGAIMGAAMAAGMSGKEIHEYARAILGNRAEVVSRMWRSRPGTLAEMMSGGFRAQFNVERILKAFLPEAFPARFEDLSIPLQVTATDFFGHSLSVFDSGDLLSAVAASAAIPAMFRPVRRDGRLLVDGGIYNPVPFDLLEGKADIIVAVDVAGAPTASGRAVPTTVELIFGANQLMMQANTTLKLRMQQPDILLRPPVSHFRVLDFLKIDALLAETVSIKDELKRELERALEGKRAAVPEIR